MLPEQYAQGPPYGDSVGWWDCADCGTDCGEACDVLCAAACALPYESLATGQNDVQFGISRQTVRGVSWIYPVDYTSPNNAIG
ncbi:hypothetical protein AMJ52_06380 [candidate division TA06 bacterium DG_78]|uniref:Uncharacterized protein n=1 Tax=candidate division TA06 bacterium DG_78 TaxID=1703772 RepID=A0A0S7YD93_UNCT6|nr:MAG: hypothetical protein AMJ52_06380 [candidate division TA06 bacterium DG_78]